MRGLVVAVLAMVLVASACNKTRSAFEQLADRANPVLLGLVLKISALDAVVRSGIRDPRVLVKLCSSGDAEVAVLRTIERTPDSDYTQPQLSLIAGFVLDGRERGCFDRKTPGRIRTTCLSWCLAAWGELTAAVNHLSDQARAEGVVLLRLPLLRGAE